MCLESIFLAAGFHKLDRVICIFHILEQDIFVYIPMFRSKVAFGNNTL